MRAFGPSVRYIAGEHRGAGAARNAGILAATGDLVAFLDSDDEWIAGKLSWQRAIMEHFADVLFLFSDFGRVTRTGERLSHQLTGASDLHGVSRSWSEILGPGIPLSIIPEMPPSAPPFDLYVGRLYETLAASGVSAPVRSSRAGPRRETLFISRRTSPPSRTSNASRGWPDGVRPATWTATRLGTLVIRVRASRMRTRLPVPVSPLSSRSAFGGRIRSTLRLHRDEYEHALDAHPCAQGPPPAQPGKSKEARQELRRFDDRPWDYTLLSLVPGRVLALCSALVAGSTRSLRVGGLDLSVPSWDIVEYRGRSGLQELEEDWKRLYAQMPGEVEVPLPSRPILPTSITCPGTGIGQVSCTQRHP